MNSLRHTITILLLICIQAFAGSQPERVWLFFTDKSQSAGTALSADALQRRQLHNIALDQMDRPVNARYVQQIRKLGFHIYRQSRWLNAVSISADENQIENLHRLSFVKSIKPVKNLKGARRPAIRQQSFFKSTIGDDYGPSLNQNEMIGIPAMHDLGFYGQQVRVALFDTGFRLAHPALQNINVIAAWDFVDNDGTVANQSGDSNFQDHHGTQVLSVIAGYSPGNLIGPAWQADFILAKTENLRVESHTEEDNWVAAVEWADSIGVDIISTSLNYTTFDAGEGDYEYADLDGNTALITKVADLAVKKGIAVFCSAGNYGNEPWYYIGPPADGDSVIAVGGVTATRSRWYASSHGPTFDGRIKPDIMAQAQSVIAAEPGDGTGFISGSGTSYAAPLVAGAGALLLSMNPSLSPMALRDSLFRSADKFARPNNDFGYGIINVQKILDNILGHPQVSIQGFNVEERQGQINLSWSSIEEIDLREWIIVRVDSVNSLEIAHLPGKKISYRKLDYSFIDSGIQPGQNYQYRLMAQYGSDSIEVIASRNITTLLPINLRLFQNFPNPFNGITTFRLYIPGSGIWSLRIYNVLGEQVRLLRNGFQTSADFVSVQWNGRSDDGNAVASGVYFAQLSFGTSEQTVKTIYLR